MIKDNEETSGGHLQEFSIMISGFYVNIIKPIKILESEGIKIY